MLCNGPRAHAAPAPLALHHTDFDLYDKLGYEGQMPGCGYAASLILVKGGNMVSKILKLRLIIVHNLNAYLMYLCLGAGGRRL